MTPMGQMPSFDAIRESILIRRADRLESENAHLREALENERKFSAAAKARVAELEAREKQRVEDDAWAGGMGGIRIRIDGPKWNIHHHDCRRFDGSFEAFSTTISGAIRALREKMEAKP